MAPSGRRKQVAKFRPTIPRLSRMASSCRSVRLRADAQRRWTFEWVATSGASVSAATSQNPFSFRCDRSSRMRRALQARTSARPASVRPGPVSGGDGKTERHTVAEPVGPAPDRADRAQAGRMKDVEHHEIGIDRLRALDMEHGRDSSPRSLPGGCRTRCGIPRGRSGSCAPAAAGWRTCAPSRPARCRSRVAAAAAGRSSTPSMRPPTSGEALEGVKAAKSPPAKPPALARGRSTWPPPSPSPNRASGVFVSWRA